MGKSNKEYMRVDKNTWWLDSWRQPKLWFQNYQFQIKMRFRFWRLQSTIKFVDEWNKTLRVVVVVTQTQWALNIYVCAYVCVTLIIL